MEFLKAIGIGVFVFIASVVLFGITGNDSSGTDNFSVGIGVLAVIVAFFRMKKPTEIVADTVSSYQSAKEAVEEKIGTEDPSYYAVAEKEILDNKVDLGLWSQALVKAGGKEELRKVEYMKLRVKQLKRGY